MKITFLNIIYHGLLSWALHKTKWSSLNACRRIKHGWEVLYPNSSRFAKRGGELRVSVFWDPSVPKIVFKPQHISQIIRSWVDPPKPYRSCLRLWTFREVTTNNGTNQQMDKPCVCENTRK